MKVLCIKTTSNGFDLKEVDTVFSENFDYSFGGYGLELDKQYLVMGIVMYQSSNCIYYLIDVNSSIQLFPYLLFEITDNSFPKEWFVLIKNSIEDLNFKIITGFYELCTNDFLYNLLNGDVGNEYVYFKRKIEMEKYYLDMENLK